MIVRILYIWLDLSERLPHSVGQVYNPGAIGQLLLSGRADPDGTGWQDLLKTQTCRIHGTLTRHPSPCQGPSVV